MLPLTMWNLQQLVLIAAPLFININSSNSASAFSASTPIPIPSWDQLQATPALSKPPRPIYHDVLPHNSNNEEDGDMLPILYRDKDCICAASETVWLALECKNVDYLTVLVTKDKEHDDTAVPRIVWPANDDDSNDKNKVVVETTDPIKLLEQIHSRYPDTAPHFYPKLSAAVDATRCNIMRLPGVMPRYSEPDFMSWAPYIFRNDGTLAKKSSHCVSLEEVEEMQEEYYLGSYLCGKEVTAADMVWGPYLERYAIQLPLLFPNVKKCNPRSNAYEEVNAWYLAMEKLPAYACCVQGDARHWRKCLEQVIPLHNDRATSDEEKVTSLPPVPEQFGWWMEKAPTRGEELWKEYVAEEVRPWLADTPAGEVALYLMRNHEDIVAEAAASSDMDLTPEHSDEALREVIQTLLDWKMDGSKSEEDDASESAKELLLSDDARKMAQFASEKIEVPRDVGMIPALALGQLVKSVQ